MILLSNNLQATRILCHWLTIHDLDPRLQSIPVRQNVAQLYLPFLDLVVGISKRFYFHSDHRRRRPLSRNASSTRDVHDDVEGGGGGGLGVGEDQEDQSTVSLTGKHTVSLCPSYSFFFSFSRCDAPNIVLMSR